MNKTSEQQLDKLAITGFCRLNPTTLGTHQGSLVSNENDLPISEWLKHIYRESQLQYPKFHKMDLLCKATFLACEYLTASRPFHNQQVPLIFANQTGSECSDRRHHANINESLSNASPAVFVYTLPNIAMGEISIRHELHSKNVFFIFEQFADENWLQYIRFSFNNPETKQVLAAWTEVSENTLDLLMFMVERDAPAIADFSSAELNKIYI